MQRLLILQTVPNTYGTRLVLALYSDNLVGLYLVLVVSSLILLFQATNLTRTSTVESTVWTVHVLWTLEMEKTQMMTHDMMFTRLLNFLNQPEVSYFWGLGLLKSRFPIITDFIFWFRQSIWLN